MALVSFVVTLGLSGLAWYGVRRLAARSDHQAIQTALDLIDTKSDPTIVTDLKGKVLGMNPSAQSDGRLSDGADICDALQMVLADPSDILVRAKQADDGRASHSLSQNMGTLTVTRLGPRLLQWQIASPMAEQANVADMTLPWIEVEPDGTVSDHNAAARHIVADVRATDAQIDFSHGKSVTIGDKRFVPAASGRDGFILIAETAQADLPDSDLERIPVPIMTLSTEGVVLTCNRLAQQILGGAPLTGRPIAAFMEGLGRPMHLWLAEAAESQAVNRSEFLRLTRSRQETYVQVSLSRAVDGETLVAVLTDATELKTLEGQFVQSQKMQAIGQLAGGVAHDFNNLLTAISGHCDLLLLRHDQGDPDYADLIQINQNANRAAALVGQLLAFSRKQNMNPELLDLRSTLSDLAHLLNRLVGEKITLTLNHDPSLPSIRADKRQLEQVMMNLVVNARDAMPEGGEIVVHTERQTLTEPLTNGRATVPPGDYARVSVSDQGVGIPPERQQVIFDPFYTTKRTGEGTGLGLSTVYGIVKQSGGFIFVDSEVGKGSTFSLLFRLHEDRVHQSTLPEIATPARVETPTGGVVLLVEDEAPVRAFASRALRLRGFTVIEADSGEAALEALEDGALEVDVVVTDVIMPGLDGPSWVREALKDRPDLQVVFVSGYPEDVFERGDSEIPNSVFLPKPFSLKELTQTVTAQMPH